MKERLLVRTAVAAMLLAFHGWSMPAAARSVPAVAGDSGIVLRVTNGSGDSLAPAERQAVEEVLLARAWAVGVVVCHDGIASPAPPAVAGICADPNSEAAPFWWDLEVETTRREKTWMASATLRLALSDGPPRKAPEIFLLGPFVLPPGVAAGGALGEALRAATASLRSSPALLGWLDGLAGRPGLPRVRPLPSGEAAGSQRPVASGAPPPDDRAGEADAWKAEVLRITDLLIEGNPWQAREAGERADRLLRDGRLPADLADRVRVLKEKAAAKLAGEPARSLPAEPPATPPAAFCRASGRRGACKPACRQDVPGASGDCRQRL